MGGFPEAKVLVFDIGGSHAAAAVAFDGSLAGISSARLNSGGSAEEIIGALEVLGKNVVAASGLKSTELAGVSFGFPNPFDYAAGISYMRHKYASLYGRNVREILADRFGVAVQAVTFVNDASAFLLGELYFGAAIGLEKAIGITLGTGVGSAFAASGRIVTQAEGVPNEGFLWNVPYNGRTVEDFVSTRGIRELYREAGGDDIEVREIADMAAYNDRARATMDRFGTILGKVLKTTCSDFRAQGIVLGGAISRSAQLFLPTAQEQLKDSGARLLVSKLFDKAALLGASIEWQKTTIVVD